MFKRLLIKTLLLANLFAFAFDPATLNAGFPSWPDETTVTWLEKEDVNCLEGLVYCLLKKDADSALFITDVYLQNHTIYWWYSASPACIIEIGEQDDLETAALYYRTHSSVRYGAPCITTGQSFWPNDDLYVGEDLRCQWFLTHEWTPQGVNPDVHINWHRAVNDAGVRGNTEVRIGIIDSGILYDEEGDSLLHPDMSSDRFVIGEYYSGNSIADVGGHGSMVAGALGADANNSFGNIEGTWGMTGVNTESKIIIYKGYTGGGTIRQFVGIETEAFKHLVRTYQPHIINYSKGFYIEENLDTLDRLWEWAFQDLLDEEYNLPLLVCAAGNEDYPDVAFPARLAFEGTLEGHERGWGHIVSVSGISNQGNRSGSYDTDKIRVNIVAPNQGGFVSPKHPNYWAGGFFNHNVYDLWFGKYLGSGTSYAAPLVSGVASLVISQDTTMTTHHLRKIIEKTTNDFNIGTKPYLDNEMGYGLVDTYEAVLNRDLTYWKLADNTWYFISSNISPVFTSIKRILEDVTVDDDEYDNGLSKVKAYDPVTETELVWQPGVSEDDFDWNVDLMVKIKLNDADKFTDSVWVCGQSVAIDSEIELYDDEDVDGWNWTAYYPDYESPAPYALQSIAESGNPESPLFLAKGPGGQFYAVHYGFSNLTMKPSEGYEMQIVSDQSETLIYPVDPPDQGQSLLANAQTIFYHSVILTGDFLPILVTLLEIPDADVIQGFEVAAFYADTLCVGAVVFEGVYPFGFVAWLDDPTTNEMDGLVDLNSLTFRLYDPQTQTEYFQHEFNIRTSSTSNLQNNSIWVGGLFFNGPNRKLIIPNDFTISNPYPNPFNSSSKFSFEIPHTSNVKITITNIKGGLIKTIYSGTILAGSYAETIQTGNLPSGLYFLHLSNGEIQRTVKLGVIK